MTIRTLQYIFFRWFAVGIKVVFLIPCFYSLLQGNESHMTLKMHVPHNGCYLHVPALFDGVLYNLTACT